MAVQDTNKSGGADAGGAGGVGGVGWLADDSDLLTAGEVAKLAEVSSQTVRNWWKAGRLTAAEERPYRGAVQPMFRAGDKLKAEIEQAQGRGGSGGRREGAGRKGGGGGGGGGGGRAPKRARAEDGIGLSVAEAAGELRAACASERDLAWLRGWLERTGSGGVGRAAEALLIVAGEFGLTTAAMERLKTHEQTRQLQLKNDETEGRLVDAEDVRAVFGELLQAVVRLCDALAPAHAEDLARRLWPDRAAAESALDALRATGTDADAVAAVERVLRPPPTHAETVRRELERITHGLRDALADALKAPKLAPEE